MVRISSPSLLLLIPLYVKGKSLNATNNTIGEIVVEKMEASTVLKPQKTRSRLFSAFSNFNTRHKFEELGELGRRPDKERECAEERCDLEELSEIYPEEKALALSVYNDYKFPCNKSTHWNETIGTYSYKFDILDKV